MNKKLEDQYRTVMETALLFYEDSLNAKLPNSVEEAFRSPDADEWQKSMSYELAVLESRGLWSAVPDEGQYCHDTKWVFKQFLADNFKIKDMGPVKTMLGINVRHDIREGVLSLDQRKMTEKNCK